MAEGTKFTVSFLSSIYGVRLKPISRLCIACETENGTIELPNMKLMCDYCFRIVKRMQLG